MPYSPDDFARVWKRSTESGQLVAEIDEFNTDHPILFGAHDTPRGTPEWKEKIR